MSWNLAFFAFKQDVTVKDVSRAYYSACDGLEVEWKQDNALSDLLFELNTIFPLAENYSSGIDQSPWSTDAHQGPGYLLVNVIYSRVEELRGILSDLGAKHHLIVYDPQQDKAWFEGEQLRKGTIMDRIKMFWI